MCLSVCVCLFPPDGECVALSDPEGRLCFSNELIIGVFHCGSFLWRRREGGGDTNPQPLSARAAKNHSAALQSKLFLGNPAP